MHVHFPYAAGMCLRCHAPHNSTKPNLLRLNINEICLDCHLQHPGRAASASMPTIELNGSNSAGHPYLGHPVSEVPDPLQGGEMSCLSCHLAHGGTKPHLLKMGAQIPGDALNQNTETRDLCEACHLRLWGLPDGKARRKHNKQK
ncbi:MAG TPA: cytochrome c3 family protein [Candidatus Sulfotelmatobacter sp.]|nr:cytochrome c3 family protein [Candidatus Sulfotelmatobacter sp.]